MDGRREPRLEWPSPDVLSRPFTNRGRRQRRHAGSCLIVSLPTRRPATASLTRTTSCGFIRASYRGKPHARLSIVQIGFIGMTSSNQAFQA